MSDAELELFFVSEKQRYKDRDGLTASRTVIFMGDFTQKLFRL